MPQGLLVQLGLMLGVAAFAVLTTVSQAAALTTAGSLVLCAGAARRLEKLPTLGLLAVLTLVPLSYLGSRLAIGSFNSFTKLIFVPAFAVLVLDWALTRRPLVLGRLSLFMSLFGLSLALSYLLNDRTLYSLWFLSRFASLMLLAFLCANAVRGEGDLKALLAVMAGSCLVSAVWALVSPPPAQANSAIGGIVRMTGWAAEDAPTFGTNALVALLICLYFLFVSRRLWVKAALAGAAGLLGLAIVYTYARGVSVVTVLSVMILLFTLRRRVGVGAVLALLALLALCLFPLVPDAYWERMTTMVTQRSTDPTMGRRLDSYRIGLELFGQRPLLGFGPGNFVAQYMSPEFRFERGAVPSVCFNLYLSIATQVGLFGLGAFGLVVGSAFRELRFVIRSFGAGDGFLRQAAELLRIVLFALLLVSLFEPTDLQKYLWTAIGAAAAAAHIRRTQLAAPAEAG